MSGQRTETPWVPPFCGTPAYDVTCPNCGDTECVHVRQEETYLDSSDYEAYCDACHVALTVWASVTIDFSDVEVTDG